jgi:hypothetical protein
LAFLLVLICLLDCANQVYSLPVPLLATYSHTLYKKVVRRVVLWQICIGKSFFHIQYVGGLRNWSILTGSSSNLWYKKSLDPLPF